MLTFGTPRLTRETLTDVYVVSILAGFLLFPGASGYADITFSKYVFFLAATGVWLLAVALCSLPVSRPLSRRGWPLLSRPRYSARGAAWLLLAAVLLSWLCSPWRDAAFLGDSRWDGLLTWACYLAVFLCVSAFTHPKKMHAAALAVAVTACCAVAVLQLLGLDPLWLYPGDLCYYDRDTLYSGAYLGTVGNTNLLDAVLCAALPPLLVLWLRGGGPLFLLPLPFAAFVLASAGGTGALLALAACAAALCPLICTRTASLRRALRGGALALFSAALALLWQPDYTARRLTPRLAPSPAVALLAAAALAALLLSLAPPLRRSRPLLCSKALFPAVFAAAGLAVLAVLWFWPGETGAAYEISQTLRGHPEDSFGSSRILIWRNCLALVPARPLLGGGPGTLARRIDINFSRFVPETGRTLTAFVDNAHSIYLGCLVNCGALGLGAYLLLLGLALRNRGRPALRAGVFCACVHGCFGLGLVLSEPIFWVLLGLLCSGTGGSYGYGSGMDGQEAAA